MATTRNPTRDVIKLVREQVTIRARDLDQYGIPRIYLQRLMQRGILRRTGRGLYMLADAAVSEHHTLVEACKRVPKGVVCLLSALQFHGLTTQSPFQVWMAVNRDESNWIPKVDYPPVRIVKLSAATAQAGIEARRIQRARIRVYCPAKTVADCFKFRNKIGLDVALEALRDCRRKRRVTMDELWHYAQICRVANVMRPYLESLT